MEQHVASQLQMMLLQQSGQASLPLSNLVPEAYLEYLRKIEALIVERKLGPLVVYWSTQNAAQLMPHGPDYRKLMRDAFCISAFSEERLDEPEKWCFLVESPDLCLIVYGQQAADAGGGVNFHCSGSLDPQVVQQAFHQMLPLWQSLDLSESNRLEDARSNFSGMKTTSSLLEYGKAEWKVIKPDILDGQLLQAPPLPPVLPPKPEPTDDAGFFAAPPQYPEPLPAASADSSAGSLPVLERFPGSAAPVMAAVTPELQAPAAASVLHALPVQVQSIIQEIVKELRHKSDLSSILQLAIERITVACGAHRGLIWQIEGDQLTVTNEYSGNNSSSFAGEQLGAQESTAVVMEFLSRFPDESGAGVITVPDTLRDTKLHKISSTLASLVELGEVRARLMAQLRCRGVFSGFIELQNCQQPRTWTQEDAAIIQSVAEMLSVVVQQARDQSIIELDSEKMKLLIEISNLFRESKGLKSLDMLVRSVELVADHMGFCRSQIYLFSPANDVLIPHMVSDAHPDLPLSDKDNPFVSVFESGRGKMINAEYSRKGDPYFGHETALIVPLMAEGERLGVLGLWERLPDRRTLKAQDKELALTIAGSLANIVRADQAIATIRADQARSALINVVSSEIRQSPKDVDQILATLVKSLHEYFGLHSCVVALYDGKSFNLRNAKTSGDTEAVFDLKYLEQLALDNMEKFQRGQTLVLSADDLAVSLAFKNVTPPNLVRSLVLCPLVHAGVLKALLALVAGDLSHPFLDNDMKMVEDLSDRMAVVISHAELFAQIERQAVTDPMTGLYNRRHFNEQLSREMDRFQRFGRPFSYIICDLDYLKKINDTLGHQFGDAAIKHIANVIRSSVRDVDCAARYGGEEFVVLLPETDVRAARVAAERICCAIREQPVEGIGVVTASVGVATFPLDAEDRDKLTELADQALYLAKHRGRNQVCSVSEDLLPSLQKRGQEALEVQQAAIKAKAEEMASIDLRLIAEHGILGIMGAIIKLIEARDAYGQDRSPRAADYAAKLAQSLHLSKDHITIISLAAVLHNVGKIALPEEILQKKGPLTPEERRIIEQSPTIGAKILEPAKHLHRVAAVIESYHEHWDGSGYPKGLKGEEIPLESRVIALVDAYIAMTSDRPYRKALSPQESLKQIEAGAGKEWDPRLVKSFVAILQKEAGKSKSKG